MFVTKTDKRVAGKAALVNADYVENTAPQVTKIVEARSVTVTAADINKL